jgi:RNA polymerase sigma-70 factor (ECF subfamily)
MIVTRIASRDARWFVIDAAMLQIVARGPVAFAPMTIVADARSRTSIACPRPHNLAMPGGRRRSSESHGMAVDDTQLVKRVAAGEHDAFAALYDRHAALVYGIARRVLDNQQQAEDITQSVFLQIWSRPQAFAGGNFAAWLARVARNAALDVLRSAAVRKREPEMPADMPSDVALEDQVFEQVRSAAVKGAVASLPDDQRQAIEYAYFGGLSYREVAERLNAPLGTVKSRIRIGLRRLFESLHQAVPS